MLRGAGQSEARHAAVDTLVVIGIDLVGLVPVAERRVVGGLADQVLPGGKVWVVLIARERFQGAR